MPTIKDAAQFLLTLGIHCPTFRNFPVRKGGRMSGGSGIPDHLGDDEEAAPFALSTT